MTAAVEDIAAALVTEFETLLTSYGAKVYRGWPRWGEPGYDPPSVSLLLSGLQFGNGGRVGRKEPSWAWRAILLADNEPQLYDMAEIMGKWFAGTDGNYKRITVTGGDARIVYGESDRYQSLTGNPDEDGLTFVFFTVTQ